MFRRTTLKRFLFFKGFWSELNQRGRLPEWLIGPVLKAGVVKHGSSSLSPSVMLVKVFYISRRISKTFFATLQRESLIARKNRNPFSFLKIVITVVAVSAFVLKPAQYLDIIIIL